MTYDRDVLITRYLDGLAAPDEVDRLDEEIRNDPDFRHAFVAQAALFGLLKEGLQGGAVQTPVVIDGPQRQRRAGPAAGRGQQSRAAWRPWSRRVGFALGTLVLAIGVGVWAIRPPRVPVVPSGGQLVAWQGGATLRRGEGQLPPGIGLPLAVGDRLETGVDGRIEISWADGSHTRLTVSAAAEVTASAGASELALRRGSVEVETAKRQPGIPPLAIVVDDWRIIHLGTVFTVSAGNETRVLVREGSVAIHAASAPPVTVRAGQVASRDQRGAPDLRWDRPELPFATAAQPFAANSLWNTPIPLGRARTPIPAGVLDATPWITTSTRITVVSGDPREVDVMAKGQDTILGRSPGIPDSAAAQIATTDFTVVVGPAGRQVWELYGASVADRRLRADRLVKPDLSGSGTTNGILATGFPAFAGMVQGDELRNGIHHAVAIHLPPAMLSAADLQAGDRLALAEDFVASAAEGGPAIAAELITALRRHGAIVVGAANTPQIGVDSRLPAELHGRVASAIQRLAPHLQRVR
jgi:hypothetical protein